MKTFVLLAGNGSGAFPLYVLDAPSLADALETLGMKAVETAIEDGVEVAKAAFISKASERRTMMEFHDAHPGLLEKLLDGNREFLLMEIAKFSPRKEPSPQSSIDPFDLPTGC